MIGMAAFVFNFAGAVMYLVQEWQLETKRPGVFYYRLQFTFDPLAFFSLIACVVSAGTLAGYAVAGWHGRRAAYLSIIGFVTLVVTLGAGTFLPGRHGS